MRGRRTGYMLGSFILLFTKNPIETSIGLLIPILIFYLLFYPQYIQYVIYLIVFIVFPLIALYLYYRIYRKPSGKRKTTDVSPKTSKRKSRISKNNILTKKCKVCGKPFKPKKKLLPYLS